MVNYRTIGPFAFEEACKEGTCPHIKGHASLPSVWIHQAPFRPLHTATFGYQYKPNKICTKHHSMIQLTLHTTAGLHHGCHLLLAIC